MTQPTTRRWTVADRSRYRGGSMPAKLAHSRATCEYGRASCDRLCSRADGREQREQIGERPGHVDRVRIQQVLELQPVHDRDDQDRERPGRDRVADPALALLGRDTIRHAPPDPPVALDEALV